MPAVVLGAPARITGSSALAQVSPYGTIRTTPENTSTFYDSFDAALDPAQWKPAVTSGGATIAQGTGGLTLTPGTTASALAYLQSVPTFIGQVPGFMQLGYAIQFLASPPANVFRFWGQFTPATTPTVAPTTPGTAGPLFDAVGFALDVDGVLYAQVWQAGAKIFSVSLASSQPADGLYHRYSADIRTDSIAWYFDGRDAPVATASFRFPSIQHLPVGVFSLNATAGPAATSQVVCTGIAVGDSGRNTQQIADGTYAFRKTKVSAGGALLSDIAALPNWAASQMPIGMSAVQVASVPLATRRTISLKASTSGGNTIYIGNSSLVTASTGYGLGNGETIDLDLDASGSVWAIASGTGQKLFVVEIGS